VHGASSGDPDETGVPRERIMPRARTAADGG
jgi:hypothetical protein